MSAPSADGPTIPAANSSDTDERLRGDVLRAMLRTFVGLSGIILVIALFERSWDRAVVSAVAGGVYAILLLGSQRFGVRRTGWLTVLWYFVIAIAGTAVGRGINDITIVLFPAGMILGALLLDSEAVLPFVVVSVLAVVLVGIGKLQGWLTPPRVLGVDGAEVAAEALLLVVAGMMARIVVQTLLLNIAERRRAEGAMRVQAVELEHRAYHDILTGLPNRSSLHKDFAGRAGDTGALVVLDLTRFREINEALGHAVGDKLLAAIGRRLEEGLDSPGNVYRLGGDEFAVLFPGRADRDAVADSMTEMLGVLMLPIEVDGLALTVGATAGVSFYPEHGRDSHELLRCADVALRHGKQTTNRLVRYSREFDEHTPARLALIPQLQRGIEGGELRVHYQPQVSLRTGEVTGVEALVRWQHPQRGLLTPAQFLAVAEASDMMVPLTYAVARVALFQLHEWNARGMNLTMAINLSVQNLLDRNCADRLRALMAELEVVPDTVEFELTETAVMSDPETAVDMLERITATGAHLAIDDFGTGYSSLAYLRRFPVHLLKIDRSFVAEMCSSARTHAIVDSTVYLAQHMGLHVVAEGVEDSETAAALRDVGCELAQGYYFAPPMTREDIDARMAGNGRWSYTTPAVGRGAAT